MFLDNFLDKFSLLDWFGLGWFLLCWLGYEVVVERGWIPTLTPLKKILFIINALNVAH